jgi:hypothetical protein
LRSALFGSGYSPLGQGKLSLEGDATAFGTFEGDPFGLGSGIVLSTGDVSQLVGVNTEDGGLTPKAITDLSTDLGLPGAEGDTVSLTYRFTPIDASGTPDASVTYIAFDFVFFSEELVEYAQSRFNDDVKILLNGVNLARLSDGSFASVNTLYTPAAGPGANSSPFELRTDTVNSDFIYNPVGTGPSASETRADGYSKVLRFTAPINPGVENVLTIEARDVGGDGLFDSGILIRGGSLAASSAPIGFTIARNDDPLTEGNDRTANFGLTMPDGGTLAVPVTVTFHPSAGLDVGAGAGKELTHTFNPGGPNADSLVITALGDGVDTSTRIETIAVDITGGGLGPVAPLVVTVADGDDESRLDRSQSFSSTLFVQSAASFPPSTSLADTSSFLIPPNTTQPVLSAHPV